MKDTKLRINMVCKWKVCRGTAPRLSGNLPQRNCLVFSRRNYLVLFRCVSSSNCEHLNAYIVLSPGILSSPMLSVLSSLSIFEDPAFELLELSFLFLRSRASGLLSVSENVLDLLLLTLFSLNFETAFTVSVAVCMSSIGLNIN